jgi:bifunctional non-homologous end joining protein LigD
MAKRASAIRRKNIPRGGAKSGAAKRAGAAPEPAEDDFAGVRVTHPDRVLFPGQGVTKRELIAYYLAVADRMLPHVAGRPLALVRCPRGSGAECFFQKHANPGWPDAFRHVRIREKSGAEQYLYIEDERGLVAAVQMGVLELHLWGSRADRVEEPDRMVFDLDPDEGLPFAAVVKAALQFKKTLEEIDLASFPMPTGGKGIHVVVPLSRGHTWDQHRAFAEAMARHMAAEAPDRYIATMSKAKRHGKIFIDYLRNTRGASAIAPYSTRARPGAHVAFPVSWQAARRLENAHPAAVNDAAAKVARMKDPWPGYFKLRQKLPKL